MERTRYQVTPLTPRQRQVLRLVTRGHTNSEIADILGISLAGAKWHVGELLGHFGVDSREQLVDAWSECNGSRARARQFFAAVFAAPHLKLGLTAAIGGAFAVGTGVTILLAVTGPDGPQATGVAMIAPTAAPTPSPTPTPVPLPVAPGAVFTPQEALRRAATEAGQAWAKHWNNSEWKVVAPPDFTAIPFAEAQWLPAITHFDASNGDNYWDRRDGTARNLWQFRWDMIVAFTGPAGPGDARLDVEVLIEDGFDGEPQAVRTIATAAGRIISGGSGGFHSRLGDERMRRATEPVGDTVRVAWLNDIEGSAWIGVFPTAEGWMLEQHNANGERAGSGTFGELRDPGQVHVSRSFSWNPANPGITDMTLTITADPRVEQLEILPGDGRSLLVQAHAVPPTLALAARFAYVSIGTMGADLTVIGRDSAGREVGRFSEGRPGSPPPAPPSRTP